LGRTAANAALDRAILHPRGNSGPARSAAAKAIGTFDASDPGRRSSAVDALIANAASADDDSLGHVLTAICEIARTHSLSA
jgi:hypothetical protein